MRLHSLVAVFLSVPLVTASKEPTSTESVPGLSSNDYGLQEIVPGVIGARIQQIRNQSRLDSGLITRFNARMKSKIGVNLNKHVSNVKNKVKGLIPRSTNDTDENADSNVDDTTFQGDFDIEASSSNEYGARENVTKLSSDNPTFYAEAMQNRLTYYLLNVTLGTPPQRFMVQVDTGSSDLWVPGRIIQFNGFDSKHSNTFKHLSDDFNIKYVKDSAQGYWAVDTFGFGGSNVEVSNLQFAVATAAPDATMGILGIGPIESEVSHVAYPNLPIMLVRDGLINRAVYSMHMGGINSDEGTILFGGSDKAKYRSLTTLPIVSKSTISVELDIVAMTNSLGPNHDYELDSKLDIYNSDYGYYKSAEHETEDLKLEGHDVIISRTPINVLLDTGTSLTYLPSNMVDSIARAFKATFESDVGMYVVHQDQVNNNPLQGINFQFENQIIYMPKSELFWPLSWFSLEPSPYYAMTILASDTSMGYNILGDSFLRNAYVIYDLDEKEIHIGQYFPSPYSHVVPV